MAPSSLDAELQKGLACFAACSKPKGRDRCLREDLAAEISVDMSSLPGDQDGVVRRDDFLAWLLGMPAGSPGLFRDALKIRASALRASAEGAAGKQALEKVWPAGCMRRHLADVGDAEEVLWQQCLLAFGACLPAEACAASHFAKVAEAGFDANGVAFPPQVLRRPKPVPGLGPPGADVRDANAAPFPLPGLAPDGYSGGVPATASVEEEEDCRQWWAGLAHACDELRETLHSDAAALDTELTPWPMKLADVIKEDLCTDGQVAAMQARARKPTQHSAAQHRAREQLAADAAFFVEGRWLREEMHGDSTELDTVLVPWRSLEGGIIAGDVCTAEQEKVLAARAKCGPRQKAAIDRKKQEVCERLPRFFEEVHPALEKESALAEMRVRWATEQALAARQRDEAAEMGAELVVWPLEHERRWPKVRWELRWRWFAMWRESQRGAEAEAHRMARRARDRASDRVRHVERKSPPARKGDDGAASCAGSESSWEVLSECSDSSWQQVPQRGDLRWLDVASEAEVVAHLEAKVADVSMMRENCRCDLEQATPALEASLEGLNCLSKSDITEVASLKAPPSAVVLVSKAMCWCFGIPPKKVRPPSGGPKVDDYWAAAKKQLWSDVSLIIRMANYDKDNMPASVLRRLAQLKDDPGFTPEAVKKASFAAAGICKWILGLVDYSQVLACIAPKREALRQAEFNLAAAEAALAKLRSQEEREEATAASPRTPRTTKQSEALLGEATSAVLAIPKCCITELKSFASPPSLVIKTMCAVLTLVGVKSPSWKQSVLMLADPRFARNLAEFDLGSVPDDALRKVEVYLKDPSFTPEQVMKVSWAAHALCLWVLAVSRHAKAIRAAKVASEAPGSPATTAPASPLSKASSEASSSSPSPVPSPLGADGALPQAARIARQLQALLGGGSLVADIRELKSFAKPPADIQEVLEMVMHLQAGINPDVKVDEAGAVSDGSWRAAQRLMADPTKLIEKLASLKGCVDSGSLPAENIERARALQEKGFAGNPEGLARKSRAAERLCTWANRVIMYYDAQACGAL